MFIYQVLQDCYFGEKGRKPSFIKEGNLYKSETLLPENAPKYFKLEKEIKIEKENVKIYKLQMSYKEMQQFVKENNIDVIDFKKETLEEAIINFKNKKAEEKELEEELLKEEEEIKRRIEEEKLKEEEKVKQLAIDLKERIGVGEIESPDNSKCENGEKNENEDVQE